MDQLIRSHANSNAVSFPMLWKNPQKSGWALLAKQLDGDQRAQSFLYDLEDMRPTRLATFDLSAVSKTLQYAYVVSALHKRLQGCRRAALRHVCQPREDVSPTPFEWLAARPDGSLDGQRKAIAVRCRTLRAELTVAAYNAAVVLVQATAIFDYNETETGPTSMRLLSVAENILGVLRADAQETDRIQRGEVVVEPTDADATFGLTDGEAVKRPLPFHPLGLEVACTLAHLELCKRHLDKVPDDEPEQSAGLLWHRHLYADKLYQHFQSKESELPRLTIIPKLAERSVACWRHSDAAQTYSILALSGQGEADVLAASNHAALQAFGEAKKSLKKTKLLADVVKPHDALANDPFYYTRSKILPNLEACEDAHKEEIAEHQLAAPSTLPSETLLELIETLPLPEKTPGDDPKWQVTTLVDRLAEYSLKCDALIQELAQGGGTGCAKSHAALRDEVSHLLMLEREAPTSSHAAAAVGARPYATVDELLAAMPSPYHVYHTLLKSVHSYCILRPLFKDRMAANEERLAPATTNENVKALKAWMHHCKLCMQAVHKLFATLFFYLGGESPARLQERPDGQDRYREEVNLIAYMGSFMKKREPLRAIKAYRDRPNLAKVYTNLPKESDPHYDYLDHAMRITVDALDAMSTTPT